MIRAVVVGGGIAGLAAAHELAGRPGVSVTLFEAGDRPGGKIRSAPLAGLDVDLGPDAFLARRPEARELCRELGLGDELVAPARSEAYLWCGGSLRRLPGGLDLGVPARFLPLARSRTLSPRGLARVAAEPLLPGRPLEGDVALGSVVRRRLGGEAHRRLVDPLVGSVNAGDIDRLSIEVTAPSLAEAARRHRSLVLGVRRRAPRPDPDRGGEPAFLTVAGGLGRLVDTLVASLVARGVDLRVGARVDALVPSGDGGYRLVSPPGVITADVVVLATPAFVTAPLLAPLASEVAATLAAVDHASVALVALAYPAAAVGRRLDGSGFLVARGEGRLTTACSWASSKWSHLRRPGQVVLRASAGRFGDARAGALDDGALIQRLHLELAEALAIAADPTEVRVARWDRAFPQFRPGHLDRMAAAGEALAAVAPGVALAGAAVAGVGLPACIGSGRRAATLVAGRSR